MNDIDELDNIANGRVWTGSDAKDNDLIDKEGGLNDAINRAKEISNIKNDSEINIVEFPKSKLAVAEALQCPTLLNNGFGDHRIEGIGDKNVPWIHDCRKQRADHPKRKNI